VFQGPQPNIQQGPWLFGVEGGRGVGDLPTAVGKRCQGAVMLLAALIFQQSVQDAVKGGLVLPLCSAGHLEAASCTAP
jgi:hypothetical protein